jgi:hypothetical protein
MRAISCVEKLTKTILPEHGAQQSNQISDLERS